MREETSTKLDKMKDTKWEYLCDAAFYHTDCIPVARTIKLLIKMHY